MRTLMIVLFSLIVAHDIIAQQNSLDFFIEKAKENSPYINKNKNEIKQVQLDLEQIRSIYSKPEVSVDANILFAPIVSHDNNTQRFEWISSGSSHYTGYDLALTDGGQYQAFISAKQNLFTGSKLNVYEKKTNISQQINENNIILSTHEIENVVSHQYMLTLLSGKQAKTSYELASALEKEVSIMQKLAENAIYKQSDLKLLEIEYQNYLLEYKTYQANYRINLNDLKLLCGISDTANMEIQDVEFRLNQPLNSYSKFLTSFRLDSAMVATEEELFNLKYKPQLSAFLNTGLSAIYQPTTDRMGFSTGLSLSWTIFDGNQKNIQSRKTMIGLQTLDFEKQNVIRQNEIQQNNVLSQINLLDERIAITGEQLKQYEALLNMYKSELAQAIISVMDFKNLLKDISSKKQENLSLTMEKQILINAYNYWNY